MKRIHWLGPSVGLGLLTVLSAGVAQLAAESGWLVMGGPLLLAFSIVAVDVWVSRLRGEISGPARDSLIVAGVFFLMCGVVGFRDPAFVSFAILSMSAPALAFLWRPEPRRRECGRF